jgi:hypothetical protein
MNWIQRGLGTYASPYRIYREVQGYAAWIYPKTGAACLGRDIRTLAEAKTLCERHQEKHAAPVREEG